MDAHEAMWELCTILGMGNFVSLSTSADIVARVRNLVAQSAETHTRLDEAGVAKHLDLPVRVGLLRKEVRRTLDGWALANSRVDQSNAELVAARGDLRVERERSEMLEKERDGVREWCSLMASERDTLAARVKEIEDSCLVVSGLNLREDFHTARRVTVEFAYDSPSRGKTITLKDNYVHPPAKPLSKPDPDVREMPFNRVTMAPPDTCDQSLTAALVEANRYKKLWRERAQKCQQALRRIRAEVRVNVSYLDEDWGADDDREV